MIIEYIFTMEIMIVCNLSKEQETMYIVCVLYSLMRLMEIDCSLPNYRFFCKLCITK